MSKAGYEDTCTEIIPRDYEGTPLVTNNGTTCVFLSQGAKSVCKNVWHPDHRPLCYCKAKPGKNTILSQFVTHRILFFSDFFQIAWAYRY